jgi:peptidoglycan/LPS O-acetylase OafA/YrhL
VSDFIHYLPFAVGHKVVVVFFVLSGYVITYVACERERGLRDFVLARVARIYPTERIFSLLFSSPHLPQHR